MSHPTPVGVNSSSGRGPDIGIEQASQQVVRRLTLRRWFGLLSRSAPWVCLITLAGLVAMRLGGWVGHDLLASLGVVGAWLLGTLVWCIVQRPQPAHALACWDESASHREVFLSAWHFQQDDSPTLAEQLHLSRAGALLPESLSKLPSDLPIRLRHRAWLFPLLALTFAATPLLRAVPAADDLALDEDARRRAKAVAKAVEEEAEKLKVAASMTPKQKEQVQKLKELVKQTGQKMKQLPNQTPRQLLSELEKRAREAEKLARDMGANQPGKLSSAMLAELARHADTADFASSAMGEDLGKMAKEATKVGDKLKDEKLPLEAKERFKDAVDKALKKANAQDKQGLVGRHVKAGHDQLLNDNPQAAGDEWDKLAEKLNNAAKRLAAQKRLQELAQALREAGQNVVAPRGGGVQQLAQLPPGQLRPLGQMPGQMLPGEAQALENMPMVFMPGDPGDGNLQGLVPMPGLKPGQVMMPIPGLKPGACAKCGGACKGGACAGAGRVPGLG
ncbi:MAG: hypothetical protein OER86_06070, partial [Phycisphaerae bacterium]|nr:hypothetical protein [Phycisphaerae bacterium]